MTRNTLFSLIAAGIGLAFITAHTVAPDSKPSKTPPNLITDSPKKPLTQAGKIDKPKLKTPDKPKQNQTENKKPNYRYNQFSEDSISRENTYLLQQLKDKRHLSQNLLNRVRLGSLNPNHPLKHNAPYYTPLFTSMMFQRGFLIDELKEFFLLGAEITDDLAWHRLFARHNIELFDEAQANGYFLEEKDLSYINLMSFRTGNLSFTQTMHDRGVRLNLTSNYIEEIFLGLKGSNSGSYFEKVQFLISNNYIPKEDARTKIIESSQLNP